MTSRKPSWMRWALAGTDMADSSTKNLIRQGSLLVASQMIVRVINLLYRIPVTNLWGDKGLGIYSDAYQVYGFFLVFASISIPTVISKMVSERIATGRYADVKKVLQLGTLLVGGIGFVGMMVMTLGGHSLAVTFFSNPEATKPMKFLGPTVFICSLMSVLRGYFQGLNDMKPTAVSEVIEGLLHAVFAVVLAYILNPYGIEWSVTGGIIGTGIGAVGSIVFLAFAYASRGVSKLADLSKSKSTESTKKIYRQMLSLMVPIVISSTIFSVKGIIDAAMFGKLSLMKGMDPGQMIAMRGIYSGKFIVLLNLPVAIGEALGAAAVPSISAAKALGDGKALRKHFNSMVKTVLLITVPCAVGLALLGKPAMRLLFHAAFQGGELFWVGSLAVVFYSISYVAGGVLNGLNKSHISMIHAAIGVAVTSVWNALGILVLDMGVYTLAVNAVLFSCLIMVLNMRSTMKYCQVKIRFVKLSFGPVVCSLIMGVVCVLSYLLIYDITGSNTITTVLSILLGILVYFVLAVNLKVINHTDMENLPGGKYLAWLKF